MLDIKKLLTKMLKNTPQIRYGGKSMGSCAANTYTDVAVTFRSPMKGTPVVVCSLRSTSTAGALGSFTISAINPTASGFTARVFNNTSAARSPAMDYIAFYGGGTA